MPTYSEITLDDTLEKTKQWNQHQISGFQVLGVMNVIKKQEAAQGKF